MGEEYLLPEESLFSPLSYISDSEMDPVSRGQTHHHSPLRMLWTHAPWNTLLVVVEAVSPSQSRALSSRVNT